MNMSDENTIYVLQKSKYKAYLKFKNIETEVFIGENGTTYNKQEGDRKTPIGEFNLGLVFGLHEREKIDLNASIKYIQLKNSMYWVSDVDSKQYNELVDISNTKVQWKKAEHLIDYKTQYEYAIEIKSNPTNMPNKGSAIFIHCENNAPTAGCIAIKKEKLIELLSNINSNTKIIIK